MVSKIDDVAVPRDVERSTAFGFKSGEIQRIIAGGNDGDVRSAWRR